MEITNFEFFNLDQKMAHSSRFKGHGNETDFPRFLHKSVRHKVPYTTFRADFGFEFAEIFVIQKRLLDSPRGPGLINEKNLKSKISCQAPFKAL
jgi:hypothetical protein